MSIVGKVSDMFVRLVLPCQIWPGEGKRLSLVHYRTSFEHCFPTSLVLFSVGVTSCLVIWTLLNLELGVNISSQVICPGALIIYESL